MASGYKFRILNSGGTASSTVVDFDDMFVSKELFLDAGLYAWGNGANGKLGNNTVTSYSSPIQVGTLTNWKQVTLGSGSTLATKTDGSLWAWGQNNFGQLGIGNTTAYSSPVQVGSLYSWSQVSHKFRYAVALETDGSLWSWGWGQHGQLGNNTVNQYYSSPVQIGALTNWKQVSAGLYDAYAIKTDGTLWAWGWNTGGELGIGNTTAYSSPIQIGALTTWKYVSGGDRSFAAIKTDGTLWTCGFNAQGVLGLGYDGNYSSPIQVGTLTNWKQVSVTSVLTAAVKTDGTLWTWGQNIRGEMGIGISGSTPATGGYYSSPVQVGTLTNWKQVSAYGQDGTSASFCIAVKTDGTLWGWGSNSSGQLGNGYSTAAYYSSPIQIGALTNWKLAEAGTVYVAAISSPDIDTFDVTPLTSLLLHFNGANASTTFTDSGPYQLSVTGGGNAQLSTAQFKFGTASAVFDGSGDSLQLPSSSALDFGIAPFTVEFWMRTNGAQDNFSSILSRYSNAPSTGGTHTFGIINRNTNEGGNFLVNVNGTIRISWAPTVNDGLWHHVAVSRQGVNLYLGVDGTIVASSSSLTLSESVSISSGRIGRSQVNDLTDNNYNGYLDEFRVTKGAALYTTTYTVPIGEF